MRIRHLPFIIIIAVSFPIIAQNEWFPVLINSADDPFNIDGKVTQKSYFALPRASKKWRLCVSFPHLKDDYWLAVNYGVTLEAKRQGVELELFEAGGYTNLVNQISQIKQCVNKGAQGVIIASIDSQALNPLVEQLTEQNIPVIDLVNGMTSKKSTARSLVSFYEMGAFAADYLNKSFSEQAQPLNIAWFPGPDSAAWVKAGDRGFKDKINETNFSIISTDYGDVGRLAQGKLVESILDKYQQVDFIAGTSATVLAAIPIIRKLPKEKRPKLLSYYMTRGVYNAIMRGQVLAAPTDQSVLQGRIAVDQLVRALQGDTLYKHAGPLIKIIDKSSINSVDVNALLAPNGFSAILSVK